MGRLLQRRGEGGEMSEIPASKQPEKQVTLRFTVIVLVIAAVLFYYLGGVSHLQILNPDATYLPGDHVIIQERDASNVQFGPGLSDAYIVNPSDPAVRIAEGYAPVVKPGMTTWESYHTDGRGWPRILC